MNILQKLKQRNLISFRKSLVDNVHYLTVTGSIAYGVNEDYSDMDVCGFCIPPKADIFPHLKGEIPGFGRQIHRFEQWQEHHIKTEKHEYDFTVYSIVKFFQLCMNSNPNMIDLLYTAEDCILHITHIGQMVRDNRSLFLSKLAWHKFRGYAHSQIKKMDGKSTDSKRYWMIEKYGFDVKFAYHVVRLMLEAEQIFTMGEIDLRRDAELLKAIRRGEWTQKRIVEWFAAKEKALEPVYLASDVVPYAPDEAAIKRLLINCLEEHYGSLTAVLYKESQSDFQIAQIKQILGV